MGEYFASHIASISFVIDSKKLHILHKASSLELLQYRTLMSPIFEGFGKQTPILVKGKDDLFYYFRLWSSDLTPILVSSLLFWKY